MLNLSNWDKPLSFKKVSIKYPYEISFLMCEDKIEAIRIGCVILSYKVCLALTQDEILDFISQNHRDVFPNKESFAKSQAERFHIAVTLQAWLKEYETKGYDFLWLTYKCEKEL